MGVGLSWQLDGMDDDILSEDGDDVDNDNGENIKNTNLTIINTNARSLCPKITSLIDCLDELEGSLAVVTETWLADGEALEADVVDLAAGAGLGMIHKNRLPNTHGVAHG